jgi:hypothetical protein
MYLTGLSTKSWYFNFQQPICASEGGLNYQMANVLLFGGVGIPVKRNIIQNYQNNMTPAGFANYVFNLGLSLKMK